MKRKRLFVGKKESLQKSIDRLDRIAKFYQSLILAILSGIIWSIYALLENKADKKIIFDRSSYFNIFNFAFNKYR